MLVIFFCDIIRQLHFGMNCYLSGSVCEILNFGWVLFFCYMLADFAGLGYRGILIAFVCSQILGYVGYLLNFTFNKNFHAVSGFILKCIKKKLKTEESKPMDETLDSNLNKTEIKESFLPADCQPKRRESVPTNQPVAKTQIEEKQLNAELNASIIDEKEKLGKFDNLWYYLRFQLEFSCMFLLENSWVR